MKNHEILNTNDWKIREDVEITAERLISTNLNIEFGFKFDPQEEYICDKLLGDMIIAFNPPEYGIEQHPLYLEILNEMKTGRMHYTLDELVEVCTKHGVDLINMDGHMVRPEMVAKHLSEHHMGAEPSDIVLKWICDIEDQREAGDTHAKFSLEQLKDPLLMEGLLQICENEEPGEKIDEDLFPIDAFPEAIRPFMNPSDHYSKIRESRAHANDNDIDIGSELTGSTNIMPFTGAYATDENGNAIEVDEISDDEWRSGTRWSTHSGPQSTNAHSNGSSSANNSNANASGPSPSQEKPKANSNTQGPSRHRPTGPSGNSDPITSFVNNMAHWVGSGINKMKSDKSSVYGSSEFKEKVVGSLNEQADVVEGIQSQMESLLNEPDSAENAMKLSELMGADYLKAVASVALKSKEAADKIPGMESEEANKISERIKKIQRKHQEMVDRLEDEKSEMYKKCIKMAVKITQMIMQALSNATRLLQKVRGSESPSPS